MATSTFSSIRRRNDCKGGNSILFLPGARLLWLARSAQMFKCMIHLLPERKKKKPKNLTQKVVQPWLPLGKAAKIVNSFVNVNLRCGCVSFSIHIPLNEAWNQVQKRIFTTKCVYGGVWCVCTSLPEMICKVVLRKVDLLGVLQTWADKIELQPTLCLKGWTIHITTGLSVNKKIALHRLSLVLETDNISKHRLLLIYFGLNT